MNTKSCLKCNKELNIEKEIRCDNCEQYIHSTCSNLSRNEVQCLKLNQKNLTYECEICKVKSKTNIIEELKKIVYDLQGEVKALKQANCQQWNTLEKQISAEELMSEIQDRQERVNNIIITNLPESGSDNFQERIQQDNDNISEILGECGVSDINFISVRLGKFTLNKTRALKVTLPNNKLVRKILKNRNKTKNPHIRIFSDQTKMQKNYFQQIRNQLQELIDSGDNSKTIKYIKNIPTIVNKNQ